MSPDCLEDRKGESELEESSQPEETEGLMTSNPDDYEKIAHSIIEDDGESIDDGDIINDAMNQGVGNFLPDMMFQNLVNNFQNAKQMYGERLIARVTGHGSDYVERNIKIPEFARELEGKITDKVEALQDKGYLGKNGQILEEGMRLAALVMYMQELDTIVPKGIYGEKEHEEISHYGISGEVRNYKQHDRFHDIAFKKAVKVALRRGHKKLVKGDLRVFERESKGSIAVVYAVDASGSMRGQKLEMAKKAGVALAFKATEEKNKTGLVVFSAGVDKKVKPTTDFWKILTQLTQITAGDETNVANTIKETLQIFPEQECTKHLIFLTDAAPTSGEKPQEAALKAASVAVSKGITISVIGIQVDAESEKFARELAVVGEGNFYIINDLDELGGVVLEDYARTKAM
jgi:Mg-chelatase subunit ChlD